MFAERGAGWSCFTVHFRIRSRSPTAAGGFRSSPSTCLLGLPPDWYKSLSYRSRAVLDPRGVMRKSGLELADDVEVCVHDSTADIRYMVLPQRPPGTDHLTEEELARLVTRDSMIGVAARRYDPVPARKEA
ncbi:MAG: nitrile hydratase subunit alpha [Acidobacteria bacterium]|nr:nitrile hydratase subunit alpha [Acidobacteriota bacterium]